MYRLSSRASRQTRSISNSRETSLLRALFEHIIGFCWFENRREGEGQTHAYTHAPCKLYPCKRTVRCEIDWKIGDEARIEYPHWDRSVLRFHDPFKRVSTLSLYRARPMERTITGSEFKDRRLQLYIYIYTYTSCNTSCHWKLCESIHPFRVVAYAMGRI